MSNTEGKPLIEVFGAETYRRDVRIEVPAAEATAGAVPIGGEAPAPNDRAERRRHISDLRKDRKRRGRVNPQGRS